MTPDEVFSFPFDEIWDRFNRKAPLFCSIMKVACMGRSTGKNLETADAADEGNDALNDAGGGMVTGSDGGAMLGEEDVERRNVELIVGIGPRVKSRKVRDKQKVLATVSSMVSFARARTTNELQRMMSYY